MISEDFKKSIDINCGAHSENVLGEKGSVGGIWMHILFPYVVVLLRKSPTEIGLFALCCCTVKHESFGVGQR